jgi:hypothetical protein
MSYTIFTVKQYGFSFVQPVHCGDMKWVTTQFYFLGTLTKLSFFSFACVLK